MLRVEVFLCAILNFCLVNCQFENFKTIAEMIIECGKNVRRVIQEPEYDSRFYVIRELTKYYHLLDHLEEKFRYKDHDAIEILQIVYNQGGPPHLNIAIDYNALQKCYKFKEGGMRDVRTLMSDTKELWEKLVNLLPEEKRQLHRTGQNIYQEVNGEASREQIERDDDSRGGSGMMNNVKEESKGHTDLITNRDNEVEEGNLENKDNNDDETEQRKQNDWFNEEK